MEESGDVSSDSGSSRQDLERYSRVFRESFEVDEEDDTEETEDERYENLSGSPRVGDSSPSQTEDS
jgi:hypothetical protein